MDDQPYCFHCANYGHEPRECRAWDSPQAPAPEAETLRKVRNAVMCWQRGEQTPERAKHFMASIAAITAVTPSRGRVAEACRKVPLVDKSANLQCSLVDKSPEMQS